MPNNSRPAQIKEKGARKGAFRISMIACAKRADDAAHCE
jgi:hypothetical protein